MRKSALLLLAVLATASQLPAVPALVNYQGYLTDSNGDPIGAGTPVNRKILFRVYDHANAGTRLWTEEHTVTLAEGRFSVLLGNGIDATGTATGESRPNINSVFAGAGDRYIGITVDNGDNVINATDTEITPRQRITSSAYALRAGTAESVASGTDLSLGTDIGLGHYDGNRLFNGLTVNGPVLYGTGGGLLGSSNNGTQTTALRWESDGDVSLSKDLSTAGSMAVGGTLGVTGNTTIGGALGVTGNTTLGGALDVTGISTFTSRIAPHGGIHFNGGFEPDPTYFTNGNFLSFAEIGASEDFIGYRANTFYFRDSLAGGDVTQPNVDVGGNLAAGGNLSVGGTLSVTGNMATSLKMNDLTVFLRADTNHGMAFANTFAAKNVNGPALFGFDGGLLATKQGTAEAWALSWKNNGDVEVKNDLNAGGKVTAKGKPAATGEEELRIIRGTIKGNGNVIDIQAGSGFTTQRPAEHSGGYEVLFNTAFSGTPTVTATFNANSAINGARQFVTIHNAGATGFKIATYGDDSGDPSPWRDQVISFIAVGPR